LLAALADKSMLRVQSAGRYDMHGLLRQFAVKKLQEEPGAAQAVRKAHDRYYAALLRAGKEDLRGARQQQVVDEIAADIDNIRVAWQRAVADRRAREIDQSLESLHLFYYARGWVHEGYDAFEAALDALQSAARSEGAQSEGDRHRALAWIVGRLSARTGRLAYRLGMNRKAEELLRKSLAVWDEIGGAPGQAADAALPGADDVRRERAFSLYCLSAIVRGDGEYADAQQLCDQSYHLFRACNDRPGMAMALRHTGIIAGSLERYEEAQDQLQQALAIYQEIGNPYGIANTLNDLGIVAAGQDQYATAKSYHQEGLSIRRQIRDLWGVGTSLNNLGYLAYLSQEYASAREFLQESLAIQREIGDRFHIANCLSNLSAATAAMGELHEAATYLHEGLQIAAEIGAGPLVLELLGEVGALLVSSGTKDKTDAAKLLTFVLHHPFANQWVRERAEPKLAQVAGDLAPDRLATARQKGQAGEWENVTAEVLSHREAWLAQPDADRSIVPSL
jgi:tetratricopeptide (TPR) repeat protein